MKINELFYFNFDTLLEANSKEDAIAKIKKLQNLSGRSQSEIDNINRIINQLSQKFNINPRDLNNPPKIDLTKEKIAKAAYEKAMAASAFKQEWDRIKRTWWG